MQRAFGPLLLVSLALAGCGSKQPQLMPTPNVYTHPDWNPFADVPQALRSNRVDVLYITDRVPGGDKDNKSESPGRLDYGHERSRSAAFGEATLQIGSENLSWDALVQASRSVQRAGKLELNVVSVRELGRFPATPPPLASLDPELAESQKLPASPAQIEAEKQFTAELSARLATTPRKEVFMFIHGFNVAFDGGIFTTGELWHFLGREGVPISYSWPAGHGVLRAYEYTRESGEFTVYHLKQTLRMIASCPDLQKIHIIAHSRGTDVITTALRELHLEIRGTAQTQKELKLGTVVLAAADMDIDVVIEHDATERIGQAVERAALYLFDHDKALSFSNWLSGGIMRLGDMNPDRFDKDELDALRSMRRLQIIDARITKPGNLGHNYFHANPAVSSDLVLLLRYQLPAGGEYGRPLGVSDAGFWIIDDDYPAADIGKWYDEIRHKLTPPARAGAESTAEPAERETSIKERPCHIPSLTAARR